MKKITILVLVFLTMYILVIFYPVLAALQAQRSIWPFLLPIIDFHRPIIWGFLGLFLLLILLKEIDMKSSKKQVQHGSAHYASKREIKPFLHRHIFSGRKHASLSSTSFMLLGTYKNRYISLSEKQQETNILLTAPVGAGKSSRVIIPNLLNETGSRSLFVSDVKGELARLTAGAVARYHDVWIFSPANPEQSAGYNPLQIIRTVEDAQEFAACWINNTGKSKEEFWPNVAKKLMVAAIMHLKEAEPDAPFSRVADILCKLSYTDLKELFLRSPSEHAREITTFFEYVDQNPKLVGSIMTDMQSRFQLLASDDVRTITATNEIDFALMTEKPVALYLSIPRRYAERYQPLLACFMLQMFATWEEKAGASQTGQLARGIICYLDEFANLGYIPNISGYISTARSSRVALLIVLQSFNQLDDRYGPEVRKNILSNSVTHLLLPGSGLEETEYYSQRIGNSTIKKESTSTSGSSLGFFPNPQNITQTQDETGRRLLMSDEIRTMPEDTMLMLHSSRPPILLQTTPYFRNRKMVRLTEIPYQPTEKKSNQVMQRLSISTATPTEGLPSMEALLEHTQSSTRPESAPERTEQKSFDSFFLDD